jgi:predicted nucleic acid-binding Zn ribbon protein
METNSKTGRSARLGPLIEGILGRFGLASKLAGWKIVADWPEIVGDKNAEHSKALRFSDETLLVKVTDAVWRQELSMERDQILKKIHEYPGGKAVKKIHFVS